VEFLLVCIDADLKSTQTSKWNVESHKLAVDTYRNAESKEQSGNGTLQI
jgi:hypothetical protein